MRIIAGKHKGRRIELSRDLGQDVRPTSDFAREAIFNILAHGKAGLNGHTFEGKRVLDLFCGTGALGLEALSRGAESVTFVDQAREAIQTARHNIERFGETGSAEFVAADATQLGRARKPYDLIFLDPPYFSNLIPKTLNALAQGGWIAGDAVIVIEHDEKETLALPEGFARLDERKYGRAMVEIVKRSA